MYARTLLPGFAGVATFLRARSASPESVQPGQIATLGVPWDDRGDPRASTAGGPRAVRETSAAFYTEVQADPRHELVDVESGRRMRFPDVLPLVDLGDLRLASNDPTASGASMREVARNLVGRQALPLFIGGGRAISAPLVAGCAAALPSGRRLGYVQLTGSLCLAQPRTPLDPSAALTSILAEGTMDEEVAWLGLHGYVPLPEWERARSGGGVVRTADELAVGDAQDVIRDALGPILGRCDAVYLTLDITAIDTAYAAGTGELQVGGLEPARVLELAEALSNLPLVALDLVGVAPAPDPSGRAERLGLELILRALGQRLARPVEAR